MSLSRAEFFDALVRQGVGTPLAVKMTEDKFGLVPELPSTVAARIARRENIEQRDIHKLWLGLSGDWYCTSVAGVAKITPGFADLWLALPRWELAFFWETKAPDGWPTDDQFRFLEGAHRGGTLVGSGTFYDFYRWIRLVPQVCGSVERLAELSIALDRASLTLDPQASIWRALPEYLSTPGVR